MNAKLEPIMHGLCGISIALVLCYETLGLSDLTTCALGAVAIAAILPTIKGWYKPAKD